jgi:hypothetical protein
LDLNQRPLSPEPNAENANLHRPQRLCLLEPFPWILLQFCYKTVFTEMEIVQFFALLTRQKHGLDSIICSLWDFIQIHQHWLLTSGAQVRVLLGLFN